jgi:hypothetical protein
LPLQIVQSDDIVVDYAQPADTGGGEILDGGGADAAGADYDDFGVEQLALTLAADFLEDDVAGVAFELEVA